MKLIFLSSRKRPFLPRICKYVHSLAKVVHIFANILTNFWQTLQVSVCSSPPVQDRRQNRAGTRPSRGFPWPGHHDNNRGEFTCDQKSFSSQHVPHSLLFSWWQPSPGSGRRSCSGDVVSKALSFWGFHAVGAQVVSELFSKPARLLVGRGEEVAETWLLEWCGLDFTHFEKNEAENGQLDMIFTSVVCLFLRLLMKIRN